MLAKVNIDKTPVKISTHWNESINRRLVVQIPTAMYRGTAKAPTIRSAMAKLISRKCGRFRSFCFKNITMVIRFPMVITTDVKANVSVQKMFQYSVKSMTNLNHKICQYCNLPAKKKQIVLFKWVAINHLVVHLGNSVMWLHLRFVSFHLNVVYAVEIARNV